MSVSNSRIPRPQNEPVRDYAPGSPEREALAAELARMSSAGTDIPAVIDGRDVRTGVIKEVRRPHDHRSPLGVCHMGTAKTAEAAVRAALEAKEDWQHTRWENRAAVFLKAADLLAGRCRDTINAATMLGQSKNVFQAEIDAACELTDYLRFNVAFMEKIYAEQIDGNAPGSWTRMEYRPLEGFVFAVTPFNFTAIGGNLPSAPALMGNTVVWKPATTAVLSGYHIMRIFQEAGLPDGVINFLPAASSREVGDLVLDHRDFAGFHFTGSTGTFNTMWKRVAGNLAAGGYRSYPRLVGETGGKDFVLAFRDADVDALSVALFRGAFEYQGQKCSATSRAYIPRSLWGEVKERLGRMAEEARVGDAADFRTFMGAVIDEKAYDEIVGFIARAEKSPDDRIVIGGKRDKNLGYFIWPTVIETTNPRSETMTEEIFGPVLTVYPYEDDRFDETLDLVDDTSPYALTGSIFAADREIIDKAARRLFQAAGNLYINDKTTGAVIGQQPFGGARMSGTNDKAGSYLNLLRWTSPRTIKENFAPPTAFGYPHMG
jgi:1-pyrroline-5-carboxylate dehydrogenase